MVTDQRFADVSRALTKNGWELKRISGSHHVFTGPGRRIVVIPVHRGKVKAVYAREVEKAVKEWLEQSGQGGRD